MHDKEIYCFLEELLLLILTIRILVVMLIADFQQYNEKQTETISVGLDSSRTYDKCYK
jgi:hypothetical protein